MTHPVAAAQPAKAHSAIREALRTHVSRTPSFTELVYAHFAWWQEAHEGNGSGDATDAYRETLARFEERHGEIITSYWCSHVESAAALTEKPGRYSWSAPVSTFHRESDWATQNAPDIARELYRCDELGVRALIVLRGIRQRICLRLVMSSAAHLLALVDSRAAHTDDAKVAATLEEERTRLDETEAYYCQAANGQAQIVYFTGMVTVAAVISLVSLLVLSFDWAGGVAALIAGSVGAVVSVVQRINNGQFELEYDVGRPYAFFLGGLRPLIGGAFAVIIAFAFTSGVLHLPLASDHTDTQQRLALVVLSFLAGFSERWAQDTLASVAPVAAQPKPKANADK
ncbi:MAG TPA: hypothetical protein VF232_05005 [Gaiellaceae bacterium]